MMNKEKPVEKVWFPVFSCVRRLHSLVSSAEQNVKMQVTPNALVWTHSDVPGDWTD